MAEGFEIHEEVLEQILRGIIGKWQYASGIGGQQITGWTCLGCATSKAHGNTAAPVICKACANILRHCAEGLAMSLSAELKKVRPV